MAHDKRNPFVVDVLQFTRRISRNEGRFDHVLILEKFWIKRFLVNPKVASLPLQTLVPFSSTYLCEKGFSALVLIKSLAVDSDLTIALAKTEPSIDQLVQRVCKLKYLISKMFSI